MADKFAGGIKAGSTSVSIPVMLRKTADSTEQTGIVASGVTATYRRAGAAAVAITASDLSLITSSYSSGGWKEADGTNQPGQYRLDVPDAAFTSGVEWVIVAVKVASCFVFYERFNLETVGSSEVYNRIGAPSGASIAADIQTRSTYAGGDTSGTTTLLNRLSSQRAANLDNLDATVSSRSTYAGADTSGTTTLIARLTSARAGYLDNLSVAPPTAVQIRTEIDTNSTKTGYKLASDGVDLVMVEVDLNLRQAMSLVSAESAGTLAGATGTTISFAGAGVVTNRITATVDANGNRTSVIINPPA